MAAREGGADFRDALAADDRVSGHLTPGEIDRLLDPAGYTGHAGAIVDEVLGS